MCKTYNLNSGCSVPCGICSRGQEIWAKGQDVGEAACGLKGHCRIFQTSAPVVLRGPWLCFGFQNEVPWVCERGQGDFTSLWMAGLDSGILLPHVEQGSSEVSPNLLPDCIESHPGVMTKFHIGLTQRYFMCILLLLLLLLLFCKWLYVDVGMWKFRILKQHLIFLVTRDTHQQILIHIVPGSYEQ